MSQDHPVFDLSSKFVDDFAAAMPMGATIEGIGGHDHEWGDLGPDGFDRYLDLLRETRGRLDELPPGHDRWDRLAIRVLEDLLDDELGMLEVGDHLRDIAHIHSFVPDLRRTIGAQNISTPEGREALTQRLETFDRPLAGWRARLEEGLHRGLVVSQRQVESVLRQLRAHVADDGIYPRTIRQLIAEQSELAPRLESALDVVRRACTDSADWLEHEYLPRAPDRDGVGPDRYARESRRLVTAEVDPVEACDWAWERIRALRRRAVAVSGHILPDASLAEVIAHLRTDPDETVSSQEEFQARMQTRQERALEQLDGSHFDVPPEIRTIASRLVEPGAPLGAFYIPPSEDFTRPGTVWWSFGDLQAVPVWDHVSTSYHEGFPGHHLQSGIQATMADRLSRAHRLLYWTPGYGEGWALYAEQVMDELGFLDRPAYEMGYLRSQLLRAVRVVIDIGLHLGWRIPEDAPFRPGEPWTYDVAVEALRELAFLPRDRAESEVTRYLGWPGQAITYALGQRAIVDLREERRRRDGDGFELKAFHADVLCNGPVSLDYLRELVLDQG